MGETLRTEMPVFSPCSIDVRKDLAGQSQSAHGSSSNAFWLTLSKDTRTWGPLVKPKQLPMTTVPTPKSTLEGSRILWLQSLPNSNTVNSGGQRRGNVQEKKMHFLLSPPVLHYVKPGWAIQKTLDVPCSPEAHLPPRAPRRWALISKEMGFICNADITSVEVSVFCTKGRPSWMISWSITNGNWGFCHKIINELTSAYTYKLFPR